MVWLKRISRLVITQKKTSQITSINYNIVIIIVMTSIKVLIVISKVMFGWYTKKYNFLSYN